MFENRYNEETNTKEAAYIPVPEENVKVTNAPVKKGGMKKILKAIGALCCVAAISAGSIAGYNYFSDDDNNKADNKVAVDTLKENEAASLNSSSDISDEYYTSSLAQLSRSENALSTQEIYKKVLPSVVGITSTFVYQTQQSTDMFGGFFGYGYGGSSEPQTKEATGTGTGIIMSSDGYIVTNAHVIYDSENGCGAANKVTVLMSDKTEYEAEVIGYDVQTDVAVIKVDAENLTAAEFGDSTSVEVGDSAIAIGNPLGFDLFGTLTVGYVSGINREMSVDDRIMHLIQTDAAINSGNSGGPLVNDCGQVIGINSMKLSSNYSSSASIEGLGFAIPINEAQKIVSDLMNHGYVTGRPQLGITGQSVTASQSTGIAADGVYVVETTPGSCADKAGIKSGDIIVGLAGISVTSIEELNQVKNEYSAGDTVEITLIRDKKYVRLDVTLEEAQQQKAETEETETEETETADPAEEIFGIR